MIGICIQVKTEQRMLVWKEGVLEIDPDMIRAGYSFFYLRVF
jgi:hypothetical protein